MACAGACGSAPREIGLRQLAAALPPELTPDGEVTMAAPADYPKRREALLQFIWGASGPPRSKLPDQVNKDVASLIGPLKNLKRIDDLVVKMDAGEHTLMHHFIPKVANNRLVIVHQGHGPPCGFGDAKGGDLDFGLVSAIDGLLAAGYSVLGKYMPHFLPDECDTDNPHPKMFATIQLTEGSVIKFFVEPLVIGLNYLKTKSAVDDFPRYISYDIMGLSGGGWSTTLYAAIDATIEVSVPVAGTSPLYMRKYHCAQGQGPEAGCYNGYYGDTEQGFPPLYAVAGYLDLYALGAQGEKRRQIQILNRQDNCCFGEREFKGPGSGAGAWEKAVRGYQKVVQAAVSATKAGSFELVIDEASTKHEVSRWAMTNVILPALNRAVAPPDAGATDTGTTKDTRAGTSTDTSNATTAPDAGAGAADAVSGEETPPGQRARGGCVVSPSGGGQGLALLLGLAVALVVLGNPGRVPDPSRDGARPAKPAAPHATVTSARGTGLRRRRPR